jgi:LmbE family N-acetylglucosaminyl deacetylase
VLPVTLGSSNATARKLLVLGAHADDAEIGCGGTILRLVRELRPLEVHWLVLSGDRERAEEASASAAAFLGREPDAKVVVKDFRDGFLPYEGAAVKEVFEELKLAFDPDLILAPRRDDAHQDHRLVAELVWNTFRDHLVLEYEIPKYEGDLGAPVLFVPLDEGTAARKVALLQAKFPSQRQRPWFRADTFWSVMRLRGIESNSPTGYAEGFYVRKVVLPGGEAATVDHHAHPKPR